MLPSTLTESETIIQVLHRGDFDKAIWFDPNTELEPTWDGGWHVVGSNIIVYDYETFMNNHQ